MRNNFSGVARVRLADLNGAKWTSSGQMDQNGHFVLANAKIQSILVSRMLKSSSEYGHFDHLGPFWSSTFFDSTSATP